MEMLHRTSLLQPRRGARGYHVSPSSFAMPRKRGNPNWGKPPHAIPDTGTEFEWKLQELGLTTLRHALD